MARLVDRRPLALRVDRRVDYGIVLPGGGTEWVPLIYGYLDETARSRPVTESGEIEVKAVDASSHVAEHRFDVPSQALAGAGASALAGSIG
ncbi:hypothetical protein [Amycolatopsis panacis]|uniref:Uncharacterized protein n=1 Tax=Amycolatopsis panacis TaxID=2340917 RepID=A0A419IC12_9PSEU|nr:hypothetical protein [Amycolatopsis panacis]RJQ92755.1 hypothetical protein D5S19_00210 [Amycolatopsis panacis]